MKKTFDHLILIGRPACGKSEFIDLMKKTPSAERAEKFHLGQIAELDDFLWLWEKFEDDDVWEEMGLPRLYSKISEHAYVVKGKEILEFMFHKFNFVIGKKYLKDEKFYADSTLFIEFARGSEVDGGYKRALSLLSEDVLKRAAVLYIDVSFEESNRRNTARYEAKLKHSVLAHKVPEEDVIRFSRSTDWHELTNNRESGTLKIGSVELPFVTMKNEPELAPGPEIAERYKKALDRLYEIQG